MYRIAGNFGSQPISQSLWVKGAFVNIKTVNYTACYVYDFVCMLT